MLFTFQYARPVVYEPRLDEYYLSRREFTDGTTTVGNSFSTAGLTWQKERAEQTFELVEGQAIIESQRSRLTEYTISIDGATESTIQANISYYPGWVVIIDGKKQTVEEHRGLIYFSVPRGSHELKLQFEETPLRRAADIVSLLSLFWFVGSAILGQSYAHRNRRFSIPKQPQD